MSEPLPPQAYIDEVIERTDFKRSVVEFLWDEFQEYSGDSDFFEYVAEMLGNASFIIAAAKGFSINGCLAAYEHGCNTVLGDGIAVEDLEQIIDEIELEGLPNTEDDLED